MECLINYLYGNKFNKLRYVFTDKRKQYYIQNGGSLADIFKAILPYAKDFAKKIIPSLGIAASSTLVSHGINKALNKKKKNRWKHKNRPITN